MGLCSEEVIMPMTPLAEKFRKRLETAMREMEIIS